MDNAWEEAPRPGTLVGKMLRQQNILLATVTLERAVVAADIKDPPSDNKKKKINQVKKDESNDLLPKPVSSVVKTISPTNSKDSGNVDNASMDG
jgi:hypothetical protein